MKVVFARDENVSNCRTSSQRTNEGSMHYRGIGPGERSEFLAYRRRGWDASAGPDGYRDVRRFMKNVSGLH